MNNTINSDKSIDLTEMLNVNCTNSNNLIDDKSIMVDVEGLHGLVPTGNYTRYIPSGMKNSIPSWTKPYCKPVIMHHNEDDGKTIGRVHAVQYIENSERSGTPALLFTINVPDEDGKEQILDGRLLTTSVGIRATDCRCSICGHNIAKHGKCEHTKGVSYNGEICYWDIYEFTGKELSYVITPSDSYAHNIKIYSPTSSTQNTNPNVKEHQSEDMLDITETLDANNTEQIDNKEDAPEQTNEVQEQEQKTDSNDTDDSAPQIDDTVITESSDSDNQAEPDNTDNADNSVNSQESESTINSNTENNNTSTEQKDGNAIKESLDVKLLDSNDSKYLSDIKECMNCASPESSYNSLYDKFANLYTDYINIKASIYNERNMRYTAEEELYSIKSRYSACLIKEFNRLRAKMNLGTKDPNSLCKYSIETIECMIQDMVTELEAKDAMIKESEEVIENNNSDIEVKESEKEKDIVPESQEISIKEAIQQQVNNPIEILDDSEDDKSSSKKKNNINIKETYHNLDKILFGN